MYTFSDTDGDQCLTPPHTCKKVKSALEQSDPSS